MTTTLSPVELTRLELPAKLTRIFAIDSRPPILERDAATGAVTSELRVPIAVSSEEPYNRWWGTEILGHDADEIDATYLDAGAPVLTDHYASVDNIRGRLENWRVERGILRADALLDAGAEDAVELYGKIARGFVRFVSVGYRINTLSLVEEVEGWPTYRITRWTPMEASFVAVPADPTVGVNRDARGTALVSVPVTRALVAPAASARSAPMPAQSAAAEPTAVSQGVSREQELAELAQIANRASDLPSWILSGRTASEIRAEIMAAQRAAQAAPTSAASPTNAPEIRGVHDRGEDRPWESMADFFRGVISCVRNGGYTNDPRLLAAREDARNQARNQDTIIGEEGGFTVPAVVSNVLLQATMTGGELLPRVAGRPVTVGNSYSETVVKEEARTNGSRNGGVRHYWIAENSDYIDSTANTRQVEGKLAKLGALVRLTEEQMQDGPAMESFLNEQVPEELRFGAELAIWEGSGVGQCLGIVNAGSLIAQPIEATQTIANTAGFLWVNAARMYARMPARLLANAAWFINSELWAKILTATVGTGASAPPAFIAPGQLANAPNGLLWGRPIIPVEYASAEGTVGDFVFANFSDYLFMFKGGIRQQSSMHVDFIRDRTALKFTWRVNGLPRTRVPLTPFKGTTTVSPYIALAARS